FQKISGRFQIACGTVEIVVEHLEHRRCMCLGHPLLPCISDTNGLPWLAIKLLRKLYPTVSGPAGGCEDAGSNSCGGITALHQELPQLSRQISRTALLVLSPC